MLYLNGSYDSYQNVGLQLYSCTTLRLYSKRDGVLEIGFWDRTRPP